MKKQTDTVIDSISANQLLQALSTLRNLSSEIRQFDISFSNEKVIRPQDFIKPHRKPQPKERQSISNNQSHKSRGKYSKISPSPLKEHFGNVETKSSNFKSRSCSPYDIRTQKPTSRITNFSRPQTSLHQKQNRNRVAQKQSSYPSSFQTKKILDQKSKNGNGYIPIQNRAEQLLKEKEKKLAKLKKEKQLSKILQEKQCTFRPQIKAYKFSKNVDRDEESQQISDFEKQRFQECFIDEEFICPQQIQTNNQVRFLHQTLYSNIRIPPEEKTQPKRYKNEKFNFLLDLIQ